MNETAAGEREALMSALERTIRRDPARRGLLGNDAESLCPGHLSAAADHLGRFGRQVWILTGFFVPTGNPPAAETDGPPGAAFLASVLQSCGMEPLLLTDRPCADAVRVAAANYGIGTESVHICPDDCGRIDAWVEGLEHRAGAEPLTHVIAIERVGPSHQPASWSDPLLADRFRNEVPSEHWNRCHNMRGEVIDYCTPPLHRVVEWVASRSPGVKTIGIGDGGNEVGMGAIPYAELRRRLIEPQASRIPCRVPTDWTILAGVSNWGAMALSAAVCCQRGRLNLLRGMDRPMEEQRLQALVASGPAVDGVTRLQEPTVDGLPFLTYLQPWETMRSLLGIDGAASERSIPSGG
ncbi:MAG: DUF4392 domain-containing protein [Planctomycetaceae bacterium]|nr:DUF4392 domain-containing protein [Planctomycetaceae bacterium]